MADPVYDDDGIDLITLTFAVVLAAAIVFLLAESRAAACGPDDDAAALERCTLRTLRRWLRTTG